MEISDLDGLDAEDWEGFAEFLAETSMKPFHKSMVKKAIRKLSSPDIVPEGLPMLANKKLTPHTGTNARVSAWVPALRN